GVIEIQVGLVGVEAMPEELAGDRVPGPVGLLRIEEDDPRALVDLIGIGPDIEVACGRTLGRVPRPLEPWVLVRGVVDDQFGDYPQATLVRLADEPADIRHGAVVRMYPPIIGDVVAVITAWGRIKGQ